MNKFYNIKEEHGDKTLIEAEFIGGDFALIFNTDEPVIITKKNNKTLYNSLMIMMNSDYQFDNYGLSYKSENEICWFSDQYCDINDKVQTDKINRLHIKMFDSVIELSVENPFFKKNDIHSKTSTVAFAPSGNGFYSLNKKTGLTFQDDMVMAFNSLITEKSKTKIYTYE